MLSSKKSQLGKWLLAIVCGISTASAFAKEQISLAVGEEYNLVLPTIAKSVDVGSARILKVSRGETKANLNLKGLQTGSTTLTVTLAGTKVLKYDVVVGNMLAGIMRQLAGLDGVKASERDGKVLIDGLVTSKEALNRIAEIKRDNPGIIIDGTEKNLAASNTVISTINRVLRENDMANIQAHSYGRIIVLEGSPANEQQSEMALRIAQMMYPGIENRISKDSNGAPAVSIEVLFVEVNKSDDATIGVGQTFGDAVAIESKASIAAAQLGSRTGVAKAAGFGLNWQVGGISTFLKLLQTKSSSRVLSNPKLVTRSGSPAKFHSGSTVYLQKREVKDKEIITEFKPVDDGIILNITPKLDAIGQIDAQIDTEVSKFTDLAASDTPSMTRSKVSTAVTIRDGQTIMLSGLMSKRNTKTVSRVPVLADIPLIGELFKSRHSIEQDTEMMILVTINRMNAQDDRAKAAGTRLWEKARPDVEFSIYD